ncbi:MAG: tRNA pseudouridine(55) synthase TruB [Deltaproteobacteria bacterium]
MDGIVIIDKPAGKTSHDVVSEVKKIMGAKKAGHTGTLDPMATGVLPICLNEATKLAQFLTGENKEYLATMLLGVKTDTLDTEGEITGRSDKFVSEEEIRAALAKMVGKIQQVPPAYSAIKHHGQPLYKYARKGIFLETAAREIEIYSIFIEDISFPRVTFRIACSKGTYIRSICSDVGEMLGCGACLCGLRRLRSGLFSTDMAVSLENYERKEKKCELLAKMLPLTKSLPLLTGIEVEEEFANKLRDGMQPSVGAMQLHVLPFLEAGDMIKFVSQGGALIAVAEMLAAVSNFSELNGNYQAAKIVRVFNDVNN